MKFSPFDDPTSRSLGTLLFVTIVMAIVLVIIADLKTPALEIVAALPIIPALLLFAHTRRMRRSGRRR